MPREQKPSAHERIRTAMAQNERDVMTMVRRVNKNGELYRPMFLTVAWSNALDRLVDKGRIEYVRRKWVGGYRVTGFTGRLS